jgi:hypothetical protein
MPTWRVAGPPINCVASDDRAAVTLAKQFSHGKDIEIRDGARVIPYVVSDQK